MARKDRVPNPPRRPQAPKRRTTPAAGRDPQRTKMLLLLGAALAVVVVAAVLGFLLLGGGDGKDEAAVLAENGCILTTYPGQEGTHVQSLTAKPKPPWNSDPPTSGTHYEVPAIWGFYDEPVPLIQSVHNLEHGGIVILYGKDVPDAQVEQIRGWYLDDPNAILVDPLDSLGKTIALTAWTAPARVGGSTDNGRGYLAKCQAFSAKAFDEFRSTHRGEGPERFPVDALTPGS